ncbi:MAG: hypothetical protein ACREDR_35575, partial [Blastocatellia bacterium]
AKRPFEQKGRTAALEPGTGKTCRFDLKARLEYEKRKQSVLVARSGWRCGVVGSYLRLRLFGCLV